MYVRSQEVAICRLVEKVDDAISTADIRACIRSLVVYRAPQLTPLNPASENNE